MLRAAVRRGRSAALAAARRTVLAPLPALPECSVLEDVCCRTRLTAMRLASTTPAAIAMHEQESAACCRLEVLGTGLVQPKSFFVPGSPVSDHYGLMTNFRVTVC